MCSARYFKNHSLGWIFLAFLVSPLYASAEDSARDPIALYHDMIATIAASDSFSVHIEKQFDVVMLDGAKVQYSGAMDMQVNRDQGMHLNYGDDVSAKEAWYDGSTVTLIDHLSNVYAQAPAEGKVGDMLGDINERYGLELPLAPLMDRSADSGFETNLQSATYLGLHDALGEACHHVLYRGANADMQLWVTTDDEPLLRKLVVTFWQIEGEPQQSIEFSDWDLDARIKSRTFKADIPDDAVQTEFLPPLVGATHEAK